MIIFNKINMQYIGASIKRKSLANIQPELPKINKQEKLSGKRTIHKDLTCPQQQLKGFKRRLIFTQTTDKSLSRLVSEERLSTLENSRTKNLQDFSTIPYTTKRLTFDESALLKNYQSESIEKGKEREEEQKNMGDARLEIDKENEEKNENQNENENENGNMDFDDYQEGSKANNQIVEEQEQVNKLNPKLKSYSHKNLLNKAQPKYEPTTYPEKRMQLRYWDKIRGNLRFRREDTEVLKIIDQYKMKKQHIIDKATTKSQIKNMITKMRTTSNLPRANSLPKLQKNIEARHEIVLPSYEQFTNPEERSSRYMSQKLLQGSLSATRLFMQDKRKKLQMEKGKDQLQEQMDDIHVIESILRGKGVRISAQSLKKGLLNMRTVPTYGEQTLPQKKLVSNPLYKITPLGY